MRGIRSTLLVGATGLLLAGCGSAGGSGAPTWVPSPALGAGGDGPGVRASPIIPIPSAPHRPSSSRSGGATPSPSSTAKTDPDVVATRLTAPVGLTLLPDGTALVGERTTGRIVQVQPRPGRPVPTVRTIAGLDASGDGGLLDLALSPTYAEDGLVYAYVTTRTDNRVVDFTLKGPVTPVLTGIPKGKADNTGRILFAPDGDLYVGTGDTGHPSLAVDAHRLAGKVLRVNDIGDPAAGNPTPSSSVFTRGHRVVDGLCAVPNTTAVFEVEAGAAGRSDDVNILSAAGDYGWPSPAGAVHAPLATLPTTSRSPGGCAVLAGRLWVTSLDGRALLSAAITGSRTAPALGSFTAVLANKYGRLKTVVAAPDGALWLTTSNRDGSGHPIAADERVIRYVPSGGSENPPV